MTNGQLINNVMSGTYGSERLRRWYYLDLVVNMVLETDVINHRVFLADRAVVHVGIELRVVTVSSGNIH